MSGLNIFNAHPRLYWGAWGFDRADAWLILHRFPGWITIPDYYSLADARLWHLLFAWPFAFGLLLFMLASLANRHFRRDLVTGRKEWRWSAIRADIVKHLKLDFSRHGTKFNFLQKLSYGVVIFLLLPLMIFTGLAMSPGMNANWPWIVDIFGGRQSARSIHFICAWALAGFFLLHLVLVLLSGPIGQLRDMITGGNVEPTE
ncbi:MAG: Prokaryotic cytochrome b561 [Proteobacteria bacterium]|nr:Prokaryotic cytochrome b561 [Pseudomonadota bacterium]